MAVSSVSSSSSTSAQQYGGNDDDTTPTNNNPSNDPPPSPTGNDAENPSSAQKDPPQGQSTISQLPPADTTGTNTTSSPPPSPSPGNDTPTNAPTGQSTSPQTQTTNTSDPPQLSSTEATQLLSRLDQDTSIPDDAANASNMATLQGDSLRGADAESINFERLATVANQQAGALPPDKRDFYGGALAAGSAYYNAATTSDQRAHIAAPVYSQVIGPIRAAYLQAMGDPNARVQMTFSKPFGSIYLGNAGQQQSDLLAQMGQQFNKAATPEERARIFGQAVDLRHTMQLQIGAFVDQERSRVQEQWKQADQEIDQALRDAAGMWIAGSDSGFDNTSSFDRLNWFISHGLNSERDAQEFQYRLSKSPDDFKLLRDWSADATQKAEWATSAIQSDPFRRTPELPPLPPDPTRTTTENSRMGNFGADMLYRYHQEDRRILDAKDMYHAASQRGPIRKEYLDAHTPPLPLWRQQLEDGLGRFFVGILPGVNLLVDYIVPARSLPGWARQGIDFASAVVGAVVPVPEIPIKLPKLGDVGELNPFKKFKPAEEIKAADEINPVEANAHGEPVNAPKPELSTSVPESAAPTSGSTSGIPLVPEEYSRSPSGKLTPDPDYRGLYRDEGGQHYIQQDGKTYPVDWNDTAHRWQMQPREGSPNAPKMHINEKGNWEVDLDTGLKGGVRPRPVESYKQAFDLYERGKLMSEIADELLVDPVTAKKWVETYVQESGDLRPQRVGGAVDKGYRLHAPKIYSELQEGKSLKEVSNKYTDGNELAGYRNATWFAEILGFPTDVIPQDRPWRIRPERDPNQIRYPISQRQYARIQEGLSQGQSTEKMGKDTGVLTSWVEKIQAGNGRYWPETQEWIQTGDVHEPAEPPAQQLHTGVEPSGSREPQPATSRPVQQQPVASAGPRKRSGHVDRFDDFREAFERYERGENFVEIGDALGVTRSSARQWVERFMSESGAVIPQRIGGRIERTYMARRAQIYHALSEGKPLAEVANDFTDGEELAALRAGRRYAAEEHLPTDRFPQERPWRIQAEGTSDRLGYRPNDQQRADIFDGFDQRKPTWQISMETGVPEDLIEQMRAEHGGIEHGNVPDPAEPPAKRQRTDGASGDTPQPQPQTGGTAQAEHLAPSGPEPSWGSPQLRQYYEDHTQLSQAESDSIDAWFNGNGPAPPSLQAELIARGYSDITPEMIRMYFTDKNPVLTVRQMQRITEFLCI